MVKWNTPWIWVLAAAIICLTRFTELGISLDPALYASVARTFSRDWQWWSLRASERSSDPFLFARFYEQPFLVFWIQGLVFRVLGANDTTARIVGLVAGCGSFYYLFRLGEILVDIRFAHVLSFLTLFSVYYVGRIPTLYLEVPLVFFMLAALFYYYRALIASSLRDAILSGVLLGAAFLTKGFAALPMLGLIGLIAVMRFRLYRWTAKALGTSLLFLFLVIGIFCGLQELFGSYSFSLLYFQDCFLKRSLSPGFSLGVGPFFTRLLETHPLHLLFAVACFFHYSNWSSLHDAMKVGVLGSFLFISANALLGQPYLHYYHSIYPMLNILAAVFIYPFAARFPAIHLQRIALQFGVLYLLVWHILPFPMRKKIPEDFYQIKGLMEAFKRRGIHEIESLGIQNIDWVYREMSLWYWDIDTNIRADAKGLTGGVAILPQEAHAAVGYLRGRGYRHCMGTLKYRILVKSELEDECLRLPFEKGLLR